MRSLPLFAGLLIAFLPARARADLDMVFLIDTTGSMSGEIREAKERVKQIAEALAQSRANERIRIGAVAFRDRGDDYITKVSPLSENVGTTFDFLGTLWADGGGDGPEDVLSGIEAAIDQIQWDLQGSSVERRIFLIGDAPPHLDYRDGPRPEELIEKALAKRIVIDAIGCRSLSGDGVTFFRKIAYATEGGYQHIGRVAGEDRDQLAKAMLSALSKTEEVSRDDAVPVRARRSPALLAPDDQIARAIQVKPIAKGGETCALRIVVPKGTALAREPKISRTKDHLFVDLQLHGGEGGAADFALDSCFPTTLPIQIAFGG